MADLSPGDFTKGQPLIPGDTLVARLRTLGERSSAPTRHCRPLVGHWMLELGALAHAAADRIEQLEAQLKATA